jgi:nitrite reductase (NADH) large subunit
VAASIFASCWNDFVLKPRARPLQDSNDYFLGNIQKDGTYSVVPRMPGGEVTPDGLMAVAQVAKKYGLYTKITGGQRVDLFGARVDQLPSIWEELIAAGFESGHAYGKSLRTVKSCVGSTWCRYGVGDAVGLAIELENRYKGLRAPHKIKFGVSGCTRECAEAQGKDVGVIATDKGWNLYVCGNGGMKPRHAELLAIDLTQGTARRVHRPLPDVLHPHGRPPAAHQHLARQPRRRPRLPEGRRGSPTSWAGRRTGSRHAARGRHLCLRMEEAVTNPETRKRFRQFVNSDKRRPQRRLHPGARPDPPRPARGTQPRPRTDTHAA